MLVNTTCCHTTRHVKMDIDPFHSFHNIKEPNVIEPSSKQKFFQEPLLHPHRIVLFPLLTKLHAIIQSENIIVHIIRPRSRTHKLKHFTKMQRIVPTDFDAPRDKNDNGI